MKKTTKEKRHRKIYHLLGIFFRLQAKKTEENNEKKKVENFHKLLLIHIKHKEEKMQIRKKKSKPTFFKTRSFHRL